VQSSDPFNLEEKNFSSKRRLNTNLLLKLALFIIFLYYLYSIFYGESSLGVLQDAKLREEKLKKEYNKLQNENQQLQKKHFELIQLTPDEENI